MSQQQSHMAQIGISVESLDQISQQVPATVANAPSLPAFVEFSRKMLENFFNFASSFALKQSQMTPAPSETFVPLSTLNRWFENFQRRMQQDPNFWRSWNKPKTLVINKFHCILRLRTFSFVWIQLDVSNTGWMFKWRMCPIYWNSSSLYTFIASTKGPNGIICNSSMLHPNFLFF